VRSPLAATSTLSLHDALPIYFFLIYGIWIFPKMGILGAAVGTLFSRVIMVVMMHIMLQRDKELGKYFPGFSLKNLQKSLIKKIIDRKSTRLNSSHVKISYAVF